MTNSRTRIKFCGFVDKRDIEIAVGLGVDAIGLILAPSARRLNLEQAKNLAAAIPPFVSTIAVVTNPSIDDIQRARAAVPALTFQFCGDESREFCERATEGAPYLKVLHVDGDVIPQADDWFAPHVRLVYDTATIGAGGGSGKVFNWATVSGRASAVVVAGGLGPDNVEQCVAMLTPYAVDVRSGIEGGDGRKDEQRMRAFIEAVGRADVSRLRDARNALS